MKAHATDTVLQKEGAAALAHIQKFVDAACARAEANMAELLAGEEEAKSGAAAPKPKKAGKGKGKGKGGEVAGAVPSAPPPPSCCRRLRRRLSLPMVSLC